jgi:F0F1-type ATP synthase assembly protein I
MSSYWVNSRCHRCRKVSVPLADLVRSGRAKCLACGAEATRDVSLSSAFVITVLLGLGVGLKFLERVTGPGLPFVFALVGVGAALLCVALLLTRAKEP